MKGYWVMAVQDSMYGVTVGRYTEREMLIWNNDAYESFTSTAPAAGPFKTEAEADAYAEDLNCVVIA